VETGSKLVEISRSSRDSELLLSILQNASASELPREWEMGKHNLYCLVSEFAVYIALPLHWMRLYHKLREEQT